MGKYATPLRYPGGKQRLTPFLIEILTENNLIGGHYAEPYAGGAGVAIELLLQRKVSHIHLNDSSRAIYAFWYSILNNTEEFCRRISSASLTIDEWRAHREVIRHPDDYNDFELGFSAFFLNRCNRSGVISGGVIGGLNQTGEWKLDARFSRNDLTRRIEVIASQSQSITLYNLDAEQYIMHSIQNTPENTLVYCDPPYYNKSSRLYLDTYIKSDHERISNVIQDEMTRKWVVSYDAADEILRYYRNRKSFVYGLQYNASKVYCGSEVFVFSDDLNIPSRSSLPYINRALVTC
jgi:DNA adenine methylase